MYLKVVGWKSLSLATYLKGLTSKTCIHSKSDKLSHSKVFLSTRITHFLSNTSQLCQENEVVLRGNLLPLKNDEKPLQPYVIGPTSKAIFLANKVHYTNPLKIQPITPFSISSIPLTKLDWRYSPKCSANPITVTLIMKWEFENKGHPIRGLYMTIFEKFLFKFLFLYKRIQMGQKMYFYQLHKL